MILEYRALVDNYIPSQKFKECIEVKELLKINNFFNKRSTEADEKAGQYKLPGWINCDPKFY